MNELYSKHSNLIKEIEIVNKGVGHQFISSIKEIDSVLRCHDSDELFNRVDRCVSDLLKRGIVINKDDVKKSLKLDVVFSQSELQLALGYMFYKDY